MSHPGVRSADLHVQDAKEMPIDFRARFDVRLYRRGDEPPEAADPERRAAAGIWYVENLTFEDGEWTITFSAPTGPQSRN